MAIYDINGNVISSGGTSNSDFGVTEYELFTNDKGASSRQAVLTYQGKNLYPKTYPIQVVDFIKKYNGGVLLTLGDSYTAYMNALFSSFAEKHGLIQDNRGVASSTIAGTTDGTVGYKPFWDRLDTAVLEYESGKTINGTSYTCEDVKLITFMGGANDWSTVDESQGIDRLGNAESEDKAQLYGACKYIFDTLLSKFPNADIVVILQPSSKSKGNYVTHLKESIVKECANMYGLHICDCCFEWYNPANPIDESTYWQEDDLHLTTEGHQAIIDKLEHTVNNLPFYRS